MAKFKLKKDTFKAKVLENRRKRTSEEGKRASRLTKKRDSGPTDLTKRSYKNRNLSMFK